MMVVVADSVIGATYAVDEPVGVVPLVVYRMVEPDMELIDTVTSEV